MRCPDPETDCTAALQAALTDTSLDHVVVPATGYPWSVRPLFIYRSDLRLTLRPGAELLARAGEFKGTGDSLLTIESDRGGHGHVSNVTVVATGATLRMRQMDYLPPAYQKAEWRHTLQIRGASDVTIEGGTYAESGGDGIYVADGGLANFSSNVLIRGATTSRAWRNGLSVISAVNLTVADSSFLRTNGTNPQCGIDLEPDTPFHRLRGIKLANITLANNSKCGFTMGPYAFVSGDGFGGPNPLDITIDAMRVADTPGSRDSWGSPPGRMDGTAVALGDSYNLSGQVTVRGLEVSNCYGPALRFGNWPAGRVSTLVAGLVVAAGSTYQPADGFGPPAPIQIVPIGGDGEDENASLHAGGIRFENCTVYDDRARDWLSCMWDGTHNHSTPPRLVNLSGSVAVHNPAVTTCGADYGRKWPVSPDITVSVACNEQASTQQHDGSAPLKSDDGAGLAKKPRHIVHVVADDFGWAAVQHHRAEGDTNVRAPNIQALLGNSVELDRFYSYKICSPARCAIQTGRNPFHVNVVNVPPESHNTKDPVVGYQGIPINMSTVANLLQQTGEWSAHFVGKYDVGMATEFHHPRHRGYDSFYGYWHHANDYWQQTVETCGTMEVRDLWRYNATTDGPSFADANAAACTQSHQNGSSSSDSAGRCVFEEALLSAEVRRVISGHAELLASSPNPTTTKKQRLFLFYAMHLIHMPLQIPAAYEASFAFIDDPYRRKNHAMVHYLDGEVGKMVALLRSTGLWDDTLLVLHSDVSAARATGLQLLCAVSLSLTRTLLFRTAVKSWGLERAVATIGRFASSFKVFCLLSVANLFYAAMIGI